MSHWLIFSDRPGSGIKPREAIVRLGLDFSGCMGGIMGEPGEMPSRNPRGFTHFGARVELE